VAHVGGFVAGQRDARHQPGLALAVVYGGHHHRHAGGQRNAVEARLPAPGPPAGAFGGDYQPEVLSAAKLFDHAFDEAGVLAAVHRDAAEFVHDRAEAVAKQRVLARPACLQVERGHGEQAEREIPVRSVRVADHHRLGGKQGQVEQLPARELEDQAGAAAQEVHRAATARWKRLRPGRR
jgi:hypothetical protein